MRPKPAHLRILEDMLSSVKDALEQGQDGDLIEELDREVYEQDEAVLQRWITELSGGRSFELTVAELSDRIDLLDAEVLCWDQVLEEDASISAKERAGITEDKRVAREWIKELRSMRRARGRPRINAKRMQR